MSDQESVALTVGAVFHGRYEIVRCIKAGGMGAVYEVIHLETRRRRALKVMLRTLVTDPELRARFKLEATVAADVDSEHIVEIFDAGVDAETGTPFLVMELLKGEELATIVERRGQLPAGEVVTLLGQAALALDRTHAAGVVHRDLKPENLFVTRRDDGSPRLKVLDFGIAKLVAQSSQALKTTRSVGTPLYMSPEQIQGDGAIGPRADLYSLGQIAYSLLVGEAYFEPEARGAEALYPVLVKVMLGAKEPASVRAGRRGVELPAAFDDWFAKAPALAPHDRFDAASEMIADLAFALGVPAPRFSLVGEEPVAPQRASAPSVDPTKASAQSPSPALSPARERPAPRVVVETGAAVSSDPRATGPKRSAAAVVGVGLLVLLAGGAAVIAMRGEAPAAPAIAAPGGAASEPRAAPASEAPAAASAPAPVVTPAEAEMAPVASSAAPPSSPPVKAGAGGRAPATSAPIATAAPRPAASAPRAPYDPSDFR